MAVVTAADIKKLRDETGAPIMEVKSALTEAEGDFTRAKEILREKGQAQAGKKAGRATGAARVAISQEGNRVAGVVLEAETDFVTLNEGFGALAKEAADALLKDNSADLTAFATDGVAKFRENVQVGATIAGESEAIGTYIHHTPSKGAVVLGTGNAEALRQVAIQIVAFPTAQVVTKDQLSQDLLAKELEVETKRAIEEGKPENIARNIAQGRVNKEFIKQVVLLEQEFYLDPKITVGEYLKQNGGSTITQFAYLAAGANAPAE